MTSGYSATVSKTSGATTALKSRRARRPRRGTGRTPQGRRRGASSASRPWQTSAAAKRKARWKRMINHAGATPRQVDQRHQHGRPRYHARRKPARERKTPREDDDEAQEVERERDDPQQRHGHKVGRHVRRHPEHEARRHERQQHPAQRRLTLGGSEVTDDEPSLRPSGELARAPSPGRHTPRRGGRARRRRKPTRGSAARA